MGSAESILASVDANMGHRKDKIKSAREYFSNKETLRAIWRELDVDKNKTVTQYEIRLFTETKINLGLHPWRFLGGITEKTMRAAFRKTQDMVGVTDGHVPKRGFTTLLKNIWYFSTFNDLFEQADLDQDSKIDRTEFSYLCQTYHLDPEEGEFDRALALTSSDEKFGLGYFAFTEYALYMIRGARKKDDKGMYIQTYGKSYVEDEDEEEEDEEEEEKEEVGEEEEKEEGGGDNGTEVGRGEKEDRKGAGDEE
jgi:hypothetical protein